MLWILVGLVVIALLIGVSAFFSSAEMAFVSVNRAMIHEKASKGEKRAIILEKLLQNPDNVISAIVIGNNLVNVFASILAGSVATMIFGNLGIGLATVVMMLMVIIFSEVTPKAYGIHNEKLALRVARSLSILTRLFRPLVIIVTAFSNVILRGHEKRKAVVTESQIMAMMQLGEAEGTIEKDEREMVNEVFEFDETRAYEVYTPKEKVVFLQEKDSVEHLIKTSIDTGFSRFPVYRKNEDDIVGMVHIKDSLVIEDESLPVKNIMRRILKIDPSMKVDDVMREMKRSKTHLALLQTREGKTRGLISLEDLVEEIFGEIADEHDDEFIEE